MIDAIGAMRVSSNASSACSNCTYPAAVLHPYYYSVFIPIGATRPLSYRRGGSAFGGPASVSGGAAAGRTRVAGADDAAGGTGEDI
jgi:hypothetical protein